MSTAFVTYLGTESFLPGVIALNKSISTYNQNYELLVIVTGSISTESVSLLNTYGIKTKLVDEIFNPHNLGNDERSYKYTFTKLRIFELTEFKKIVYIDADMLVCNNIQVLFDQPHMSAVVAGSLYPPNYSWKDLNSGLLVIEPDKNLFTDLLSSIKKMPSQDGSDQGFLHSFYKDWPADKKLHLDHKYNVPYLYLDHYCQLPGFEFEFEYKNRSLKSNMYLIHYWDKYKPWDFDLKSLKRRSDSKLEQSLILWWDTFLSANKQKS